MTNVTKSQQNATLALMRRIAELRIEAEHLDCTVDEYIASAKEYTAKKYDIK